MVMYSHNNILHVRELSPLMLQKRSNNRKTTSVTNNQANNKFFEGSHIF